VAPLLVASLVAPAPASGGVAMGNATEWTQLLNNAELVGLTGQSAEQISNQVTQIGQLAEQIQNQLKIYENMLQNTLTLSCCRF
jgi:P-type conjugative transfer protein TrbJ